MSAQTLLRRAQRRAERLFVDACEIRGPGAWSDEVDPETGLRTWVPGELRYSGACKIQTYEANESTPESGQHLYTIERYRVHLPESAAPDVDVDDEITVTASLRPSNVDRRFRITGTGSDKTFPSALRLQVDEITA